MYYIFPIFSEAFSMQIKENILKISEIFVSYNVWGAKAFFNTKLKKIILS